MTTTDTDIAATRNITKTRNRQAIIRHLTTHGNVTKRQLQLDLQLSLPTITGNIRALEHDGIIAPGPLTDSTGGRKSQSYRFNPSHRTAIGVTMHRNTLRLCAIDLQGRPIATLSRTLPYANTNAYYQRMGSAINDFAAETEKAHGPVLGVSFAIPGAISADARHHLQRLDRSDRRHHRHHRPVGALPASTNPRGRGHRHDRNAARHRHQRRHMPVPEPQTQRCAHHERPPAPRPEPVRWRHRTHDARPRRQTVPLRQARLHGRLLLSRKPAGGLREHPRLLQRAGARRDPSPRAHERLARPRGAGHRNVRCVICADVVIGGEAALYLDHDNIADLQRRVTALSVFGTDHFTLRLSRSDENSGAIGAAMQFTDPYMDALCGWNTGPHPSSPAPTRTKIDTATMGV